MIKMFRKTGRLWQQAGLAAILVAAVTSAGAETAYPSKPIRIVVPYAPGGAVDIVTRLVGQKMGEYLKQPIIVDNRAGAGTNIGMSAVAKSDPDGYTLLTASNTLASNGALYKNMTFDPRKDFAPIGSIGYAPLVVVVPQASRFKSLQDMISWGRAHPGKLSYGSAGNGSSGHLASELLKDDGKFEALHIPYKGGAPAINDLLGERIDFMSINPLEVVSHIQSGKLRAVAVMDKRNSPLLPSVPTVTSMQLAGSTATVWWGLTGPKGMPPEIVTQLNLALRKALADPAVVKRMEELGAVVTPSSPAEFASFVAAETEKWGRVIKTANIQAD